MNNEERYKKALQEIAGTFVTYPLFRNLRFWEWRKQAEMHRKLNESNRDIAQAALDPKEEK